MKHSAVETRVIEASLHEHIGQWSDWVMTQAGTVRQLGEELCKIAAVTRSSFLLRNGQ
jgi:hypothetical protein